MAEQCSIGVVIRDRLSVVAPCLRMMREQGLDALPIVAVIGGADSRQRTAWEAEFPTVTFVFTDELLTSGRSRSIVLEQVTTPVVALIDADVRPRPGWLSACCERLRCENVAVVVPLILESEHVVHAAGNFEYLNRSGGVVHSHREQRFVGMPYGEDCELSAMPVDYGEAHCLVCDVEVLRSVGGFDEQLTEFDDVDLGRRVRGAGFEVWFEPSAVVLFQKIVAMQLEDIDLFAWRWAPATIRESSDRFAELWDVDIDGEGSLDTFVWRYNLQLSPLSRRLHKQWALTLDRVLLDAFVGGRALLRRTGRRARSTDRSEALESG